MGLQTIRLRAAATATCLIIAVAAVPVGAQQDRAKQVLGAAGFKGGLIVHLGCGDGALATALRADHSTMVQGLDRDPGNVERARQRVLSAKLYGPVTIDRLRGDRLPFDDGKAADLSGNENHGTLQGAQAVTGKRGGALRFRGVRRRPKPVLPHSVEYQWTQDVPLHVRAMVVAGDTLFVAGPRDLVDEEEAAKAISDPEIQAQLTEQVAVLKGGKGAVLRTVSTADGSTLAEKELPWMPRWDGVVAANGKLYAATTDGKVVCME